MADNMINKIMTYIHKESNTKAQEFQWLGAIDGSKEEFNQVLSKLDDEPNLYCIIYNTETRAVNDGHWVALIIDTQRDGTVEFFDSLGDMPEDWRVNAIRSKLYEVGYPYMLKFKYNAKENQGLTNRCGIHAILFLLDRIYGKTFEQSSKYTSNNDSEVKNLEHALNDDDNDADYRELSKSARQNFYYY